MVFADEAFAKAFEARMPDPNRKKGEGKGKKAE
jgi:hypothetical protein